MKVSKLREHARAGGGQVHAVLGVFFIMQYKHNIYAYRLEKYNKTDAITSIHPVIMYPMP